MSIILRRQYDTKIATVLIFGIFCPQGISWGTDNSLRVPRGAAPSRHSPTFAQIKPAKINLSLFGRLLGALEGADHVDLVERSIGGKVDDKRKGKGQQHG